MAFVEMLNYEIHIGASLHLTVKISNNRTLIACFFFPPPPRMTHLLAG